MQGLFGLFVLLISKLVLSTSTLQWLKVPCVWRKKSPGYGAYCICFIACHGRWGLCEVSTHFIIWNTSPAATCVQSVSHSRTWTQVSYLLLPASPILLLEDCLRDQLAVTVLCTSRGLEEGTHKPQCPARRVDDMGICPTQKEHPVLGIAKDNWNIS